jgi:hypothetical protein
MKYWEMIADDLARRGWTWGFVSVVDADRRTLFNVDAHRGDGKRFVVCADDLLTAFMELQRETRVTQSGDASLD